MKDKGGGRGRQRERERFGRATGIYRNSLGRGFLAPTTRRIHVAREIAETGPRRCATSPLIALFLVNAKQIEALKNCSPVIIANWPIEKARECFARDSGLVSSRSQCFRRSSEGSVNSNARANRRHRHRFNCMHARFTPTYRVTFRRDVYRLLWDRSFAVAAATRTNGFALVAMRLWRADVTTRATSKNKTISIPFDVGKRGVCVRTLSSNEEHLQRCR